MSLVLLFTVMYLSNSDAMTNRCCVLVTQCPTGFLFVVCVYVCVFLFFVFLVLYCPVCVVFVRYCVSLWFNAQQVLWFIVSVFYCDSVCNMCFLCVFFLLFFFSFLRCCNVLKVLCFTIMQGLSGAVFHCDAMSNRCCVSRWCNVQQVPYFTVMQCPNVTVFHYDSMSSRCCSLLCYNGQQMLVFDGDALFHRCRFSRWYSVPQLLFFTVIQCPIGAVFHSDAVSNRCCFWL